jgi:hypothetical protein
MTSMYADNASGLELEGRISNGGVSLNIEDGASVGTVYQKEKDDKNENMEDSAFTLL